MQYLMVIGIMERDMAMESKFIQIQIFMREIGIKIKDMDKECINLLLVYFIKVP